MDIHKPKPWHGWREFLKEYAIIVVGVLTALGAEQIAERIHEAHTSAEARENIRAEIAANLADLATGAALSTTPAGNGTVPQSTINTIANILATCVNSTGSTVTSVAERIGHC